MSNLKKIGLNNTVTFDMVEGMNQHSSSCSLIRIFVRLYIIPSSYIHVDTINQIMKVDQFVSVLQNISAFHVLYFFLGWQYTYKKCGRIFHCHAGIYLQKNCIVNTVQMNNDGNRVDLFLIILTAWSKSGTGDGSIDISSGNGRFCWGLGIYMHCW